jgi:hypothetical protein
MQAAGNVMHTKTKRKPILWDMGYAVIASYILVMISFLVLSKDFKSIYMSIPYYLMCASAPFIALTKVWHPILVFLCIVFIIAMTVIKADMKYRKYLFLTAILVWQAYGAWLLISLSGGA